MMVFVWERHCQQPVVNARHRDEMPLRHLKLMSWLSHAFARPDAAATSSEQAWPTSDLEGLRGRS